MMPASGSLECLLLCVYLMLSLGAMQQMRRIFVALGMLSCCSAAETRWHICTTEALTRGYYENRHAKLIP